ncbi:MFS transporter, partial [Enterococcus faecalis]
HWSKPFFIIGIPTFIVGILFYTILKEKVIRRGEEAARAAAEEGPQEKISLKEIFSNGNLLAAFILCFTSIYANFVII